MRPRVVVSRCIEGESVRWDGGVVASDFVARLRPHVDMIHVCPEVAIGLGVPRDPLRIIREANELHLIQPSTGRDVTTIMRLFITSFLNSLSDVDGFILVQRSPTSALRDARIYPNRNLKVAHIAKGPGFFGQAVLERFPHLAVEDVGRLRNPRIKAHFLTKLFTLARFRLTHSGQMKDLVQFHSENKLLLKAHHQKEMRVLGRIVANPERFPIQEILTTYQEHLFHALQRPPHCGSNVNVLLNTLGYFSKHLTGDEKQFFLEAVEQYRHGNMPLSVVINMLRLWQSKYQIDYLKKQTFFTPYPPELMDIDIFLAYCDGKNYWRD